jgi:hypothetical protein
VQTAVPTEPGDITNSWLSAVLGGRTDPISRPPPEVTRIGEEYGFASDVYRVSHHLRGSRSTCVVKLWSTEGQGGSCEPLFYREFGGYACLPSPGCSYAAIDPDSQRGILVLEDIGEGVQGDCLETVDVDVAARVAASIAGPHARWWQSSGLADTEWLPFAGSYSREDDWFDTKGAQFSERFGDRLYPQLAYLFEAAPLVVGRSNDLLAGLPETLIHGDLHLDNIIFGPEGRVVVLDWARVARGPGVLDLCNVLLMVAPGDQMSVFDVYLKELLGRGVKIGERALISGVTGAMLRKFVACTYGLAGWYPASPREERVLHDAIARVQAALLAWREWHGDGIGR